MCQLKRRADRMSQVYSRHRYRTVQSDVRSCLLYTSDAADERSSVDLGGRRIIKQKKEEKKNKKKNIS